ncbi:unnamed protein product [Owenia fusiformis]|uniref:Uncharacterized protein n=1 Tax=Owenia fusiformis TaxID=6347 RepID=A0A8J1XKG6_OWEFU|nr:unnamed protein product [Owenia fusiformis]
MNSTVSLYFCVFLKPYCTLTSFFAGKKRRGRGRPKKAAKKSRRQNNASDYQTEGRTKKVWKYNYSYPCLLCDKKYRQQSHLDAHINMHTGAKPYKCEICLKRFASTMHKQMHLKRVHGIRISTVKKTQP